jgi:arylformamidase
MHEHARAILQHSFSGEHFMLTTFDPAASPIDLTLEANYSLRSRHPERGAVYDSFARDSAALRQRPNAVIDVSFGDKPTSRLDIFLPDRPDGAPLLVFIHGGYWRALDKSIFSFIARHYVEQGIAVAMPNYALTPAAPLGGIIQEVCQSIHWLSTVGASQWGYDARNIVLSGHSAGGHMAVYAASKKNVYAAKHPPVSGVVSLSGIFDLTPLRSTSINNDLRINAGQALEYSVKPDDVTTPSLILAAGALETEGFQQQSQAFAQGCSQLGMNAQLMLVPQRTHFDILVDLAEPQYALFSATRKLFDK